ncbi:HBS1-like protein-like [Planoprotostelium fungivorum]|uniref:HBS1-like protein-like n=1 Tax=Planoprotostelium fungivorum TaxID=1890364 RepID=A0A2P6NSX6_9EUKA|nr:HBS1-like protein-like [Planoprotostelium fungivorum]
MASGGCMISKTKKKESSCQESNALLSKLSLGLMLYKHKVPQGRPTAGRNFRAPHARSANPGAAAASTGSNAPSIPIATPSRPVIPPQKQDVPSEEKPEIKEEITQPKEETKISSPKNDPPQKEQNQTDIPSSEKITSSTSTPTPSSSSSVETLRGSLFALHLCDVSSPFDRQTEVFASSFLCQHFGKNLNLHQLLHQEGAAEAFRFDTPSPDDIVFSARKQSFKQKKAESKKKTQEEPGPVFLESFRDSTDQDKKKIQKKINTKRENRQEDRDQPLSFKRETTAPVLPSKPTPDSKSFTLQMNDRHKSSVVQNVRSRIEEETKGKEKRRMQIAVVGAQSSGKSSLLGSLLHQMGYITNPAMHKAEKDAKSHGKPGLRYSYLLDEYAEERKRYMTMDYGIETMETELAIYNVTDCPGSTDFRVNFLSALSLAQVGVLVVDGTDQQFHEQFTQTDMGGIRESIFSMYHYGIQIVIVAINKMDAIHYNKSKYNDMCRQLREYMMYVGYPEYCIQFVPLSAMQGVNLFTERKEDSTKLNDWYNGPTFMQLLDSIEFPAKDEGEVQRLVVDASLRMSVNHVYKANRMGGLAFDGRIETGKLSVGDKVVVVPQNEVCTVKSIQFYPESPRDFAMAGDVISMGLNGIQINQIGYGSMIYGYNGSEAKENIPVGGTVVSVQLVTCQLDRPLLQGDFVEFFTQSTSRSGILRNIVLCDVDGNSLKTRPRLLQSDTYATAEIVLDVSACHQVLNRDCVRSATFFLRCEDRMVAAGRIKEVVL